jgi:hypothetical protein
LVQRTARHHLFEDLLRDQAEEQHHGDLIDGKCQGMGRDEVALRAQVGP